MIAEEARVVVEEVLVCSRRSVFAANASEAVVFAVVAVADIAIDQQLGAGSAL